ncbi:MAG: universal stress protein [Desulfobacterales bacterium]|nr:universal stress protein [Desulfobacterales bacterium]
MDIQKLLFVTKFDELRFDALQSLLPLQKAALQHVVFLNVIEREKVSLHRGTGYQKEEEVKLREKANIRFIDWAETLFEQGLEVGVYIVVGDYIKQVVDASAKEEIDLIVLSPTKKGKLEQLFSGSEVTEILHRSGVPVLVYKNLTPGGIITDKPFDRILMTTDWSEASGNAIACLKNLGALVKEIHVAHVAHEKSLAGNSAMAVQKTRKQTRNKLERICDIFEAEGIHSRPHVYIGEVETEIEKAAHECRATMIVAGAKTEQSWKERILGSLTKTLIENSIFPILLIPPEKGK